MSEHCLFGNDPIPTETGVLELVQRDSTRPGLTPHCHEVRSEGTQRQLFRLSGLPSTSSLDQMSPYPGLRRTVLARVWPASVLQQRSSRDKVSISLSLSLFSCPSVARGRTAHLHAMHSRCLSGFPSELPLCIAPQRLRPRTESPKTPSTLAIIWPWAPKSASLVTGTCSLWEGLLSCLVVYEIGNPASKALGCVTLPGEPGSSPDFRRKNVRHRPGSAPLPRSGKTPTSHPPRQSWQSQRSPSPTMHDAISPQHSKELQLIGPSRTDAR